MVEMIARQEQGRLGPGLGIEEAPRDLGQRGWIARRGGLVQHPPGLGAELQLVRFASLGGQGGDQAAGFGLQAAKHRFARVGAEEIIVGAIEQRPQVAHGLAVALGLGHLLGQFESPLGRAIGGQKHALDQVVVRGPLRLKRIRAVRATAHLPSVDDDLRVNGSIFERHEPNECRRDHGRDQRFEPSIHDAALSFLRSWMVRPAFQPGGSTDRLRQVRGAAVAAPLSLHPCRCAPVAAPAPVRLCPGCKAAGT